MDIDTDHYTVLGLPSDGEGAKLSEKEISKAYKLRALELHPDKNKDPDAHDNFQKLKSSYEILKDEKTRKLFDDLLQVRRERLLRQSQQDAKRRKMVSDLEERERSAFASDLSARVSEEESIARRLREEITRIRAMQGNKAAGAAFASTKKETRGVGKETAEGGGVGPKMEKTSKLEKEKILHVSWEKGGIQYTAGRLTEVFSQFGEVEDVVIKSSKKKSSALVVMATKDAAVAARQSVCGDLSNPLLVLPLEPAISTTFTGVVKVDESNNKNTLFGVGHQAFEDSVLQKLKKAASKQK